MRARPLVWVLTTSSQSTAVLLEAWMLFWPRAMLTAGIMRETSPARWPALCGSAAAPPGEHSNSDNRNADRRTRGEFVFIAFSSKGFPFYLLLLSEPRGTVKLNSRPRFASANRPAAKRPRGSGQRAFDPPWALAGIWCATLPARAVVNAAWR